MSLKLDDCGGIEEILRRLTKRQRSKLRAFREVDASYDSIGYVDADLVIENDAGIRQRIAPDGRSATCRTGSLTTIRVYERS